MAGRNLLGGSTGGRNLLAGGQPPAEEQSFWQKLFNTPIPPNPITGFGTGSIHDLPQTLDDTVRSAANAITLGGTDRLASWLPGGGSLQEEVAKTDTARERLGPQHYASDIGAQALVLPEYGIGWGAAKLGVPKMLGYGLEGAAASGLEAFNRGESAEDIKYRALIGGGFGAAGAGLGGFLGRQFGDTGGELKNADDALEAGAEKMKYAEDAPAVYGPEMTENLKNAWAKTLAEQNANIATNPRPVRLLDEFDTTYSGQPTNVDELDKFGRRIVHELAATPEQPSLNRKLPHDLRRNIDVEMTKNAPLDINTGQPRPDVPAANIEGRRLEAQGQLAKELEKADEAARFRASQGKDWQHALETQRRNEYAKILADAKASETRNGFSPTQLSKLDEIVNGGWGRQATRYIARNTPNVFSFKNLMTGGLATPLIWIGKGVRGAHNVKSTRLINDLQEMVRNGVDVTDQRAVDAWRKYGAGAVGTAYRNRGND